MAIENLNLKKREPNKKAKKLRREGLVPGVIYSPGTETIHVTAQEKDLIKILENNASGTRISATVDGEKTMVIIKDIQLSPVGRMPMNFDFQELNKGEAIKTSIPLYFENKKAVESSEFVVQELLHEIDIQTIPKHLIDYYTVDVIDLKDSGSIFVKDLNLFNNEDIEVLNDPEEVVAALVGTTKTVVEETEEASAEPVVIGAADSEE